jgi:hypothetical protein
MAERRALVEGLKPATPAERDREAEFVFGGTDGSRQSPRSAAKTSLETNGQGPAVPGRVPLTTRIRQDLAAALKRASLERQLAGVEPNSVQEILEAALEPWLREHGFLS